MESNTCVHDGICKYFVSMDQTRSSARYDRLVSELKDIVHHTMDEITTSDYISVMPRYFERTGFEPATTVANGRNLYEKLAMRSLEQKLSELQVKERLDALLSAEKRAKARKAKADLDGLQSLSADEQPVETWALSTEDLLACALRNPRAAYIEELRRRDEAVRSELAALEAKVKEREEKVHSLVSRLDSSLPEGPELS